MDNINILFTDIETPSNIRIANNIHLGTQDNVIFWYIWGENLDIHNIIKIFRTIFSGLLEYYTQVECVMFCIDDILEDTIITKVVYIFQNNESNTLIRKMRLISIYKGLISELIMIGQDFCKTIRIENKRIKFTTINFFGCHALIAGQLTYLQSRITSI